TAGGKPEETTTYTIGPAADICLPGPIISGPDGNLWYGDPCLNQAIVRLTTAGVIAQQYRIPSNPGPASLAVGPDGAIWFPEAHILGRLVPGGAITEYNVPVNISIRASITAGGDGAIWFTDGSNTIIRAVAGPVLLITTTTLPAGAINTPYSANVTAQGGTL